jgi:hypothetical protein
MKDKEFKAAFGLSKKGKSPDAYLDLLERKFTEATNLVELLPDDLKDDAEDELHGAVEDLVKRGRLTAATAKPDSAVQFLTETCLPDVQAFITKTRKAARAAPRKVKVGTEDVEIFYADIAGYEDMSPTDRAKAEQLVGQKIVDGKQLYEDIAGDNPPQVSQKGVTDLCWAMKSLAQSKNGPYTKGAMTIPNGEKMRKWLDGLGDTVYLRSSSHLTEQQKRSGQQARGMDFYKGGLTDGQTEDGKEAEGSDGLLPGGMKTLLFQQVTLPDKSKALYMKMETAGAFGTNKWNWYNGVKGDDPDPPPQTRPKCTEDKARTKEHGDNYMGGVKEAGKREDVPKEVVTAYKTLTKSIKDKPAKAKLVSAGGKPFRLNKVMHAVGEMVDNAEIPGDQPEVVAFLEAIEEFAGSISDQGSSDFSREAMEARFGGEAILTTEDLGH